MTEQTNQIFEDRIEQFGELFTGIGDLMQEVREIRNGMVSHSMLQSLTNRILRLEGHASHINEKGK